MTELNANLKLTKEVINFINEDKEVKLAGIRVSFCPKISKFFMLEDLITGRRDNAELLKVLNPNLYQWYSNVSTGAEMYLKEFSATSSTVFKDIYSKSDNEL